MRRNRAAQFGRREIAAIISRPVDMSATKTGWTAGGGIEGALAGNWSAKVEYLYVDLGSQSVAFPVDFGLGVTNIVTIGTHLHDHVVRLGLNCSFGGADPH